MTKEFSRKMFTVAAAFNWIVALLLFFYPALLLGPFGVTPLPEQTLWIQQFAGLVFFFGIGYYWAARNLYRNQPIIRLAILAKLGVVAIGTINVASGDVSWQFLLPASADGVFACLFMIALKSMRQRQTGSVV